jgi:hypothetical protein
MNPLFGPRCTIGALVSELPLAIKDAIRRVGDPHPMNPLFGPRCTIGALVSELPLAIKDAIRRVRGTREDGVDTYIEIVRILMQQATPQEIQVQQATPSIGRGLISRTRSP